MFIIGIIIFLAIIFATILAGAPLYAFLDLMSLFIVLGLYFAVLVSTSSLKDFAYGMKCIVKKKFQPETNMILQSIETFKLLDRVTLGIGLTGLIMGIVGILSSLTDLTLLGPSFAVALLVGFYCILLNTIYIKTSVFILKKRSKENQ